MKKYLFIATALVALASCSDDTFIGDQGLKEANENGRAIGFNLNTPAVTRATGSEAAGLLNSNFVVFGYKTTGTGESATTQTVFDNYQVNWVTNTAGTTESNSADWEYVGYKNLPVGVSTNVGITAFSALTGSGQANAGAIDQSIKYWDFSASAYDFFAYSLGAGVTDNGTTTYAKATAMSNSTPCYSITGDQVHLGACYISKKKTITPSSSSPTEVDLEFVNFLSKIQLGFFETIPGYSVKDLKFYIDENTKSDYDTSADGQDGLVPALYGEVGCIPTGGTYDIAFDDQNAPVVTLSGTASSSDSKILFGQLTYNAEKEYEETVSGPFLGRTSNNATTTSQINVLPNSSGAVLTLKIDYTLVSRDKTGETIQVTGATATVPAAYTAWKPNYAYTYLFKITDDKLVPITLDAIVTATEDGSQTTITTVDNPSITTYQNGAIVNEYSAANGAIYVVVGDGTTTLTTTNAKLYTATIEDGAAQGLDASGNVAITEAQVANAIEHGTAGENSSKVVTDANGKKLTVTPSDALSILNANETVGGVTFVANKTAKFTPADKSIYVFEYIDSSSVKHYKVIKVGTPVAVTTTPNP